MSRFPFTPPPLPPQIDLSPIIKLIAQANIAVARYDEAVKRLPDPMLIRRAFETKEAVSSSKIEGTQATLEEVLGFDAVDVETEENEKQRDYKEIRNYRKAIDYGRDLIEKQPLSENLIKQLHKLLLNSVRGKNKNPGEFRRHQVHIGPAGATLEEASYVPPAFSLIPSLFSDLINYTQDDNQPDRLVQAAIAHYQFEAIHPFADGNGRVGRLIIPIYLFEKNITHYPNLYISEFLEKHRRDYYETLNKVSENDEWIGWITFFLRAVREQAKISQRRVEEVEKLYKTLHERLPEFKSIYTSTFLDALFAMPVFSVSSIGKKAGIVNGQTLYNLVNKFVDAKLLEDLTPNVSRGKLYSFNGLLDILNRNE